MFHEHGAPDAREADWTGRWWNLWGPLDFVAIGSHIKVFSPTVYPPFAGASDISLTDSDRGLVTKAPAAERFGEMVARSRDRDDVVTSVRVGGQNYFLEAALKSRMRSTDEANPKS